MEVENYKKIIPLYRVRQNQWYVFLLTKFPAFKKFLPIISHQFLFCTIYHKINLMPNFLSQKVRKIVKICKNLLRFVKIWNFSCKKNQKKPMESFWENIYKTWEFCQQKNIPLILPHPVFQFEDFSKVSNLPCFSYVPRLLNFCLI